MGQNLSLLVGILLAVFYLLSSLWIASHRRFWYDEISTVLIARLPGCATIWSALGSAADVLPASYFMLVRIFDRALGPSELAARIPSALALAAGLLIAFDCARRLTDNLHALASLGLLSCSLLPYYGYEARSYGIYFMLAAMELWLWLHAPDNHKWPAVLFGAVFFLAFSVHYYTALCLVPYGAYEASTWKPWRAPSPKLLAGSLGILCGVALFSLQILAARTISRGFWAPPSRIALLEIFGELFPFGLFIGAAALIWIAWSARPEKLVLDPMLRGERLGWFFLLIPIAGYVAAKLVTNAFYNRYFIGMLPGVALAFACALWRHFHHRPGLSAGIVAIMLFVGVGYQVSVMAAPGAIEPPSNGGDPARLSDALDWESTAMKDGKKTIAVPVDGLLGVEVRYYSKHPERYAFVVTPRMGVVARTNLNLAQYQPMHLWSLEDLRAAARDTALFDPSDEMLKAIGDAGLQIRPLASHRIKVFYLE
jgi:Dolichyl-phosphate-mannose-protein mannosyltransferase